MNGESINDRPGGLNASTQDPGEIENRLSLNPSDPDNRDFLGSWEDGEEYTMIVKLRQISPGEFEVTKATPQDAPAEESGEQPAATDDSAGTDAYGDVNPAVARMMSGPKS